LGIFFSKVLTGDGTNRIDGIVAVLSMVGLKEEAIAHSK
jgi:hypothetical protein